MPWFIPGVSWGVWYMESGAWWVGIQATPAAGHPRAAHHYPHCWATVARRMGMPCGRQATPCFPAYVALPASRPGRQERACVVGWCTGPTVHGVTKHQLRHNSRIRNQVTDSGRSRHSTGLYIYETVSNKSRIRGRRIKGVICRWFYACAPLVNQRRRLAAK